MGDKYFALLFSTISVIKAVTSVLDTLCQSLVLHCCKHITYVFTVRNIPGIVFGMSYTLTGCTLDLVVLEVRSLVLEDGLSSFLPSGRGVAPSCVFFP